MDELNAAIERLCEAKGFHFKTFECPPWEADDGPCPWPKHTAGPEVLAESTGDAAQADRGA